MPAYYFLIPKNHPQYADVLIAAEEKHTQHTEPGLTYGITEGILTENIIKVAGGDQAWFETLPQSNLMTFIGAYGDPVADAARFAWEEDNIEKLTLPVIPKG